MQIPPTKIQKYTYHANDGFPPKFQYPAIETLTHVIDDNVTQASVLNMCLAHIVVVCPFNQLYAPSSMSFISFIILSNSYAYVALAAFQNNSLIIMPGCYFLKLSYKCLTQILCSYYGHFSATAPTPAKKINNAQHIYIFHYLFNVVKLKNEYVLQ